METWKKKMGKIKKIGILENMKLENIRKIETKGNVKYT